MMGYENTIQTEKKIVACGSGYVIRITREIALMGLNPGDVIQVTLTKQNKGEDENVD